jgi:hypothetical protein
MNRAVRMQGRKVRRILTRVVLAQDAAGMPPIELIERSGIGRATYFNLTCERITNPSLGTVLAMMEPLGLTLAVIRPHHEVFHDLTRAEVDALIRAAQRYAGGVDRPHPVLFSAIQKILQARKERS